MTAPESTGLAVRPQAQVTVADTAGVAAAASAKAMIEASYLVARHQPRVWLDVRSQLLETCKRPGFAAAAIYSVPKGGKNIQGLSIRFAEEAARCMGNLHLGANIVFEDDSVRVIKMTAVDLQSNLPREYPINIDKTVERRFLKDGQEAISYRQNSTGQITYRVSATPDEINVSQAREMAKAERQLILKYVPADILDEAKALCLATMKNKDAEDPQGQLKIILDKFHLIRVDSKDLERLLGYSVEKIRPIDLTMLRTVFTAVSEGECTFEEAIDELGPDSRASGSPAGSDEPGKGLTGLKAKMAEIAAKEAKKKAKKEDTRDPNWAKQRQGETEDQWTERLEAERIRREDAGEAP